MWTIRLFRFLPSRFLLLPFLLLPSWASAAEPGDSCSTTTALPSHQTCFDGTVIECKDPGRLGQAQAALCAGLELKQADAELNSTYKKIIDQLARHDGGEARSRLVAAQRAWLRFRDAECAVEEELARGGWPAAFSVSCQAEITWARVKSLESRFGHLLGQSR